jgi:hypothetical protein
VRSVVCWKTSFGLPLPSFVDQTCTLPVDRPPVTRNLSAVPAVAVVVSMMVL